VLLAHFDRPKGKVVPAMSLGHIRPRSAERLGVPVKFAEDCIGAPAKRAVAAMEPGDVLLA
jgi:phosphoglycerate kinase